MKAIDFETNFDANQEDILGHLDLTSAKRLNNTPKRVNVDFPEWMIHALDKVARHLGVTRQSIIKIWLAERLAMEQQ